MEAEPRAVRRGRFIPGPVDPSVAVRGSQARTAFLSVIAAAVLVAIKLVTGLLTGSLGLIAEAAHSATDLMAALLTFFAVRVAVRPPDRDHPFGHGKAQHLAALGEGSFLVAASVFIGYESLTRLLQDGASEVRAPWYAFAVLAVVLVIDASRSIVSWRAARRFGSAALAANALHFASDLLGSLAVLIGLALVAAGMPSADALAALVVAVLVVGAAAQVMRVNLAELMDRAPPEAEKAARRAITRAEPTVEVRRLRIRQAAGRYFADVVVGIQADAAVGQGHAVADDVESAVRRVLPDADVVVHVEPRGDGDLRARARAAAGSVRGIREVHNVHVTQVDGRPELSLHLKAPATLGLEAAHALASRTEEAIRAALPELAAVHSHIEPLDEVTAGRRPGSHDVAAERAVAVEIVHDLTGSDPQDLGFQRDERGLVMLLTVGFPGEVTLSEAHARASEVRRLIRARAPRVADVLVHTEPWGAPPTGS
ncbi:MAG: cation diffusion facilitator family transporter [Solirubrobacterales bacterium]|nr:cation diffusion facilitator family transporter [Solirubrobacterales bacterium]